MKRYAFTMMEMIFVIVVIGILAATMAPSFQRSTLIEATEQFANHIRYAQHLALVEDKYDPTDANWYKNRWQIVVMDGGYAIGSNRLTADVDYALSTLDKSKRLATKGFLIDDTQSIKDLNLSKKFDVSTIAFTGGCANVDATSQDAITFDHLGRPLIGLAGDFSSPYERSPKDRIVDSNCTITLTSSDGISVITIAPETGSVTTHYN